MNIETIHNSLVNGQRRQMVKQIDEYGAADFFADYKEYLGDTYIHIDRVSAFNFFTDAVISYHRIKER